MTLYDKAESSFSIFAKPYLTLARRDSGYLPLPTLASPPPPHLTNTILPKCTQHLRLYTCMPPIA